MKVLDEYQKLRGDTVEIERDYYWFIPRESRYAVLETPTEFTVGQLSDDWHDVTAIARGDVEPTIGDLHHLAGILLELSGM